jgi:hypothetical protein
MASEHFSTFQVFIHFLSSLDEALNYLNLESNVSVLDKTSHHQYFLQGLFFFFYSSFLFFRAFFAFARASGLGCTCASVQGWWDGG